MTNNLESDRSVTTTKMYPMDLAPQKITIVKSVSNTEVKMAHLISGQPKSSTSPQLMSHPSPSSGLMRPIAQIISSSVSSQPQMIVSGSPILQGTQIVSQGSQIIGQGSQINISQPQLITHSGQLLSPGTQIISQGTQLSAPVSSTNNTVQVSISSSSVSGTQMLNVGGQLVSGSGNLVVNSSVRTLPPTVRVLSPMPQHNARAGQLPSVSVNNASGMLVSKSTGNVTSHVPRGLAAGASLAVRPVTPASSPATSQVRGWSGPRSGLVFGARPPAPRPPPGPQPLHAQVPASHPPAPATASHSTTLTLPTTCVLTSNSVISGALRGTSPRAAISSAQTTTPRALPLLQRNYQPAKVVGVANVGVRGVVGNSAPTQLYYEVPRAYRPPLAPYAHAPSQTHQTPSQVNVVNAVSSITESRSTQATAPSVQVLPRPSILRKREIDGSPTKSVVSAVGALVTGVGVAVGGYMREGTGWEDVAAAAANAPPPDAEGGSTTISASSSPAPDDEPDPPLSPRKKPRKQALSSEVRKCDFQPEESPPSPPPVTINAPKRPLLSSSYVCGWRGTALHFVRPADVRRREPRARDVLAIASQRHVLSSADGWKVHHLTAQMDDLMSLESDVGDQLASLLRALETASGRALSALQPHSHTLLELLKGNIQRSKIVCEGIQEAREDILRVFTHRNFVSDILTRQADKRCFRKHRSQS